MAEPHHLACTLHRNNTGTGRAGGCFCGRKAHPMRACALDDVRHGDGQGCEGRVAAGERTC